MGDVHVAAQHAQPLSEQPGVGDAARGGPRWSDVQRGRLRDQASFIISQRDGPRQKRGAAGRPRGRRRSGRKCGAVHDSAGSYGTMETVLGKNEPSVKNVAWNIRNETMRKERGSQGHSSDRKSTRLNSSH